MTSSRKAPLNKRRRTYVRLIGEINHVLNEALAQEFERRQLTMTKMGEIIDRDKSFVSKKMNGTTNMTLETLADLAYALNRPVKVTLPSREPVSGANHKINEAQPQTSAVTNGATALAT